MNAEFQLKAVIDVSSKDTTCVTAVKDFFFKMYLFKFLDLEMI